jgi:hypothetical protein
VEGFAMLPVGDDAVTAYEAMWWLQVWHGDPRLTAVSDLESIAALPDELFEAADAGLPDHLIAEGLGRLVRDASPPTRK